MQITWWNNEPTALQITAFAGMFIPVGIMAAIIYFQNRKIERLEDKEQDAAFRAEYFEQEVDRLSALLPNRDRRGRFIKKVR